MSKAVKTLDITDNNTAMKTTSTSSNYVNITPDSLTITADQSNLFIQSGSGNDTIKLSGGTNTVDAGSGTNLIKAAGLTSVLVNDIKPQSAIIDDITGMKSGDSLDLMLSNSASFTILYTNSSLAGSGLTINAISNLRNGQPEASATLGGFNLKDLTDGKLSIITTSTDVKIHIN